MIDMDFNDRKILWIYLKGWDRPIRVDDVKEEGVRFWDMFKECVENDGSWIRLNVGFDSYVFNIDEMQAIVIEDE